MGDLKSPQLRMILRPLDGLPKVEIPTGYELRTFQPGDEQLWVDVLNSTDSLGKWDMQRAFERLQGPVHVVAEGIHFITSEGVPVATACLTHHEEMPEAELGWVAVSPTHQGKGLGYQVCLATLHYIAGRGYPAAILYTDDHRLPAIKTYLQLGFRPLIAHESQPERWREVLAALKWPERFPEVVA